MAFSNSNWISLYEQINEASDAASYLINLKLASKVAFFIIVYIFGYYSTLAFVYMMHKTTP
jgi:hypothetical protein